MAHFAKLDANNIVTQVIVVANEDTADSSGVETESIGVAFCQKLLGASTNWKQTSYNGNFRGNYAGIGYTYISNVASLGVGSTDIFISQQPYDSWAVGVGTAQWYPPSNPGDAPALTADEQAARKYYVWNETNYKADPATAWVLTTP
ncbi:MAG: hypothetical protein CL606_01800 [Anaerolineaceae bacterium]|nr:hypothetical protein [Anaerolineaceae bacterium]